MAIYKRGRIWWIDFYDQSRRRVFESSHSTSRREAERLLAVRRAETEKGQYQAPCRMTVDEFAEKYLVCKGQQILLGPGCRDAQTHPEVLR